MAKQTADRLESAPVSEQLAEKILAGERIDAAEAQALLASADLLQLGLLADAVRRRLHPEKAVTYIIDRNINYTDICISACKFCAFFKAPEDPAGEILNREELGRKIEETKQLGGNQILLQGGLHPDQPLEFYEDMLSFIKSYGIHVHGFSPPEIHHFAALAGIGTREVLVRLQAAGLDSMPGGGAEILADRVRREIAPRKCNADQWIAVMEQAHELGMRTTATMMFGHIETMAERVEHLQRIRDLQDRTGGFTAFIPWPFQPDHTALVGIGKTTAFEYLKMLAVSRIFLDNVDNIQASWVTQGPKIAQVSLSFGANDFGSTMIEENVVAAAGVSFRLSEEEIRRLVVGAGFTPRRRRMDYTLC
ncbi:cyclic dehypoxanthinyl futalosine synthase [Desulfurivibrio alkaliphilus]|uniref:Cyclic dehypoxanthine futalosine synthase n=1 Tax=Desulfurivibrio alkaliphilus (strain DSM 19089 / UNIQEM U267 / AHT2) TaxID=589865 RepID=D6Z0P4_DESAT|nr:cyclic dehypoxanthinyl futalosine synthase [Desulfurivibrio alkaliphilus]ADH85273.1 Radical SAM domain protein [Desulfurivibrio alkaliphilus AHT 2]